ncbi:MULTISPECIES: hypothetical protein [unclassified Microcoleus]|nr:MULTISPECIES: hypothetical protein [unclassified Microcoleus]
MANSSRRTGHLKNADRAGKSRLVGASEHPNWSRLEFCPHGCI